MADTKYLQKRKGIWYIRLARPPKHWGTAGREFLHSLKTADLRVAQRMRDKYIIPLLVEDTAVGALEEAARLITKGRADIKERVKHLKGQLGGLDDTQMTIAELMDKFLKAAAKSDYKGSTLKSYTSTMVAYQTLMDPTTPVTEVTKKDLQAFRDRLMDLPANWLLRKENQLRSVQPGEKKVSPQTMEGYLRRLRRFFYWAIDEDLFFGENPAKGVKVTFAKTAPKPEMTVEEADLLMAMPYPNTKVVDERSWIYLPLIARYTGARLAEVGQLRREDIITQEGMLCLSIGTKGNRSVKTDSSVRVVPIAEKLLPQIKALLKKTKPGRLFPGCGDWKDDTGYLQVAHGFKIWNRHAKTIGPHLSYHSWRRYAVTQMANAGIPEIDRMRIVGHTTDGTHAIYTAENLHRYKAAVDTIP